MGLGLRGPVPVPVMPGREGMSVATEKTPARSTAKRSANKLLVFSHDLNWEGASISLFELITALRRKGLADPEVITFDDGPLRSKYEKEGIPVSCFSFDPDSLSTSKRLTLWVNALAALIREKCPEVILVNTLRSFLAVLAAKEAQVPSVWTIRESASWDRFFCYLPDSVAQKAIGAICLPYRVVFVSHASRKIWERFDRYDNFEVIHNGIDLSRFSEKRNIFDREQRRKSLGMEDGVIAILCVGTINKRKGQEDLVSAISFLPPELMERIQIFFVGDDRDPYAGRLKRKCRVLSSQYRRIIRFFPSTEEIQRFYETADLFVLCSREESFPRVTLEAMAFGLPIITTPVFGVKEQVVEGENAFFYETGNARDLARKIQSFIHDESLRKNMGLKSAQRFVELTTFDKMVDAYATVCRGAAKKV